MHRFMKNVANILQSIQADVPQHAQPVLRDLAALVGVAAGKVEEYDGRGPVCSAWHLCSEKVCPLRLCSCTSTAPLRLHLYGSNRNLRRHRHACDATVL